MRSLILLPALAMLAAAGAEAQSAAKPNVIIILADDLGYGDLSCYGATKISTPNIDRLAKAGRRFTDAHPPCSVCTPSRYNLLTGRYAWRTWVKSSCVWANDPMLPGKDRYTLGGLFQSQGYTTALIGKWHLGFGEPGEPGWDDVLGPDYNRELTACPIDCGFDYFYGIPHVGQFPHVIFENRHIVGLTLEDPLRITPDDRPGYELDYLHRPRNGWTAKLGQEGAASATYMHEDLADMLTQRAVDWIAEQPKTKPFFLYFAHRNIHAPLSPNGRYKGKNPLGVYGDFIDELDASVGRILDTLDREGLTENTIVLFASDNGGVTKYKASEEVLAKGHLLNGPLRGQKTEVYEGGVRIPLIARWPGHIPAATESGALVALTDMLATFADFFQKPLPADAGEDSFSFLGPLLNQPARQTPRTALVDDSYDGTMSIRQENWKLILGQHGGTRAELPIPNDPSLPPGQLYDLSRDLGESVNEYEKHPELVKSLTALLEKYQTEGRSAPVDRTLGATAP